ncbi:unnamed protein product [Rhizophagus irregularis]|nr:unnamed protein product [Rhizophagus irregularis]
MHDTGIMSNFAQGAQTLLFQKRKNKNAKKSKSPSFSPVPTLSPAIPTPTLSTSTPTPASPITTTTAIKFKNRKSSLNNIISSKHSSRGLTYPQ